MQVAEQLCSETGRDAELRSLLQGLKWQYSKRLVDARSSPREIAFALQVVGALPPAVARLLGAKVRGDERVLLVVCTRVLSGGQISHQLRLSQRTA